MDDRPSEMGGTASPHTGTRSSADDLAEADHLALASRASLQAGMTALHAAKEPLEGTSSAAAEVAEENLAVTSVNEVYPETGVPSGPEAATQGGFQFELDTPSSEVPQAMGHGLNTLDKTKKVMDAQPPTANPIEGANVNSNGGAMVNANGGAAAADAAHATSSASTNTTVRQQSHEQPPLHMRPLPTATWAEVAGSKAAHQQINRANLQQQQPRINLRQDAPFPKYFTTHYKGWAAVIEYSGKNVSEQEVYQWVEKNIVDECMLHRYSEKLAGASMLAFNEEDRFKAFVDRKHIEIRGIRLDIIPAYYSTGRKLEIEIEKTNNAPYDVLQKELEDIFKDVGNIIYYQYTYRQAGTAIRFPNMKFILDIPRGFPKDLKIPRVAHLLGSNALFYWKHGGRLCFRCGEDSHVRADCPRGKGYSLYEAVPRETPLMATAFPPEDPDYTVQKNTPKKNTTTVGTGTPDEEGKFLEQTSGKNRKRKKKVKKIKAPGTEETLVRSGAADSSGSGSETEQERVAKIPRLTTPAATPPPTSRKGSTLTPDREKEKNLTETPSEQSASSPARETTETVESHATTSPTLVQEKVTAGAGTAETEHPQAQGEAGNKTEQPGSSNSTLQPSGHEGMELPTHLPSSDNDGEDSTMGGETERTHTEAQVDTNMTDVNRRKPVNPEEIMSAVMKKNYNLATGPSLDKDKLKGGVGKKRIK